MIKVCKEFYAAAVSGAKEEITEQIVTQKLKPDNPDVWLATTAACTNFRELIAVGRAITKEHNHNKKSQGK